MRSGFSRHDGRSSRAVLRLGLLAALASGLAGAPAGAAEPNLVVDAARIVAADEQPQNWLAHGRTYGEQRFSPLDSIDDSNVKDLGLAWATPTDMRRGHEASPLILDGRMFLTLPWSVVVALDAATGERLWTFDPEVPPAKAREACCDVINRGVAAWGGNLYVGTIDGRLVAVSAATGEKVWEVQTTDPARPYTITGAPRVVKGKVVIGNGGSEYGVRGYVTAYDAATGAELWRFYTVPGDPSKPFEHPELEAAAKTWTGDAWWKIGGGGTAWDSMAYDPDLNLLYVGTGNGSPWNRKVRSPQGGDNLYLSSILAIDPDTGRLKWHYQTTPADTWDYTATQHIVLAELKIDGRDRKVLMQAPKNGFFYVLDRETGELLSANNYVDVSWASHVDLKTGKPVETGGGDWGAGPKLVFPSPTGGHNWQPMSFSPKTGLVYIPALSEGFLFVPDRKFEYDPHSWNTGVDFAGLPRMARMTGAPPPVPIGHLKAWDPVAGKEVWRVEHKTGANGGILSTAGNLVFQGTGEGRFVAYRANDGAKLWESQPNVGIVAPPVSYAVDGVQYVVVVAGWGGVPAIVGGDAMVSAASMYANWGHVLAYKLGGTATLPEVERERTEPIPEPPADGASKEIVLKGERIYHTHCFQCHGVMGVSSGVIADLRYMNPRTHQMFDKIVLEGAFEKQGMAGFADVLDRDASAALHAYVNQRAREDRALQLAPTPTPAPSEENGVGKSE